MLKKWAVLVLAAYGSDVCNKVVVALAGAGQKLLLRCGGGGGGGD